MDISRILVIRHSESILNAQGRWAGNTDPPLSEKGVADCHKYASLFADFGISEVFSTDLLRSIQTAEIIADHLGLSPVKQVPGLKERDVGAWTNLDRSEIISSYAYEYDAWITGRSREIPQGESWEQLTKRANASLVELASTLKNNQTVLVVSHAQVLSAVCESLGIDQLKQFNLEGHWLRAQQGHLYYAKKFVFGSEGHSEG